ncbi:hypothetical protein PVMG_03659 [Plasmodium vivax Mauritania I]|uniref:PIR Superfamily Protein n=1 Tax=Plasmodium vivax Mauritania I TaxID=1035515 RepID=A0A0J9TB39_PLAVI|nr:hypothetical protein PVMG_03659 [Plasmodium vivax Mauritania I]
MSEKTEGDFIKLAEKDLTVRYQLIPGKNIKWDQHNDQTKIVDNYYCNPCDKFKKKCKTEAYDFCKLIRKNLEQIYAISPGKERKKHCLYYKNWFYEKLMNMFNSNSESKCFNEVLTEFEHFKVYAYYGYIDYSCQYDLYEIKLDNLKIHVEKKYLHDYFNNYDMIDNSIRKCDSKNKNIYKEYLTSIIELYKKHKNDECSFEDHNYMLNNCENYFYPQEYYNPQNLLSILDRCNLGQEIPKNIIKEKNFERENSSPKIKLKCSEGTYWNKDKFILSMICTDKQKGDIENVVMKASPSFSYYQIIFNGIFTLIGVFFLFFLFYKVKILP